MRRRVTRRLTRLKTMYNVLKCRKTWWNNDELSIYRNRSATAPEPEINSIWLCAVLYRRPWSDIALTWASTENNFFGRPRVKIAEIMAPDQTLTYDLPLYYSLFWILCFMKQTHQQNIIKISSQRKVFEWNFGIFEQIFVRPNDFELTVFNCLYGTTSVKRNLTRRMSEQYSIL